MAAPSFRKLLESKGTLKVGTFIGEFTTSGIGQILKVAGCDFAMVDMEHTGLGFETVKQALRSLHDAGIASMTRPPSKEYHHIARLCDVGAQGIMPPMISTAEEAKAVVSYMKYVPQGVRGCALIVCSGETGCCCLILYPVCAGGCPLIPMDGGYCCWGGY